jgi:hypothetical protein
MVIISGKVVSLPADSSSLLELHNSFAPSHHGRGTEEVYDESYRLARELPAGRFDLGAATLDITRDILPVVSTLCHSPVRADMYKLNSYATVGYTF